MVSKQKREKNDKHKKDLTRKKERPFCISQILDVEKKKAREMERSSCIIRERQEESIVNHTNTTIKTQRRLKIKGQFHVFFSCNF